MKDFMSHPIGDRVVQAVLALIFFGLIMIAVYLAVTVKSSNDEKRITDNILKISHAFDDSFAAGARLGYALKARGALPWDLDEAIQCYRSNNVEGVAVIFERLSK